MCSIRTVENDSTDANGGIKCYTGSGLWQEDCQDLFKLACERFTEGCNVASGRISSGGATLHVVNGALHMTCRTKSASP